MKKITFLILTLLLAFSFKGISQGLENFDNSNATSSYSDNNFVGEDGITWYYIASRNGNNDNNNSGINLPALMLRRLSDGSKVYSETISGGVGNFSVKLYKGFTGGGNRQVELFINDVSQGTSIAFDDFDEHIFTVDNINVSGDIVIRIDNITAKQVIVDDITWTSSGGGNLPPVIANISNTPLTPLSTETVSVSADVTDTDGTVGGVELHWGTASGVLSNTISMSVATAPTYTTDTDIPAQADGTTVYYEIYALDDLADATTSPEQSYVVTNPLPAPTNHVASFTAGTPTASTIPLTWLDNDGATPADGFIIKASTSNTFADPVDGTPEADDTDMSDGSGQFNVAHGVKAYTFSGLNENTQYFFKIWPYTNSGAAIDYKLDGTVPTADETTTGSPTTTLPYNETFDSNLGDCYTYNVSGATKEWEWVSGGYAGMNGYNSGDVEEDWLIIPGIDFNSYSNEVMTFDTWYQYGTDDADNYLKLMYSADYSGSGDPLTATWTELSYTQPSAATTWASSGNVDVSSISGTSIHIAYKYHYNSGSYRSWRIDNISITETSTDPEPTNYPTAFTATTNSSSAITNAWTDATGTQLPAGYLILANLTGSFTSPVDGIPVSDDTDLSDGEGAMNVAFGTETYQWASLVQNTQYFFTIYPYTNSATTIDYKTDGTAPTTDATTGTANLDLIISEVSDPGDNANARFVELYNLSSTPIDLSAGSWYLTREIQTGTIQNIALSGTIAAGAAYVIANNSSNFTTAYGFTPDQSNGNISGNGDDSYQLYYDGNHTSGQLIDIYGVPGVDGSGTNWDYKDTKAVRIRSVGSPNTTWTASEWDIPAEANVVNMTPGQDFNYVTWQGTTDGDWNTKANWDNGFIPDASMNITIESATNNPSIGAIAACYQLALNSDAVLTVQPTAPLTIYGDFSVATSKSRAAASFTINSDATGSGSVIVKGSVTGGTITAQRYISNGMYHGISAPVAGATAQSLYSTTANVYLKYHTESTNAYTNVVDLNYLLGDMKGFMMWYAGATGETFDITGDLRGGAVSSALTRTAAGAGSGWNFVGNPYTSAIDWDAASGWTKTNIGATIYLYNNGTWDTWNGSVGTGLTSGNIAMGQGFFVEVSDNGSTTGTLAMTNAVQVHNSVGFLKNQDRSISELVRLEINNGTYTDETVIYFNEEATNGYDSQFDGHKLFSFNQDRPHIYSTANDFMAINALPIENTEVLVDVSGVDGETMTITATEIVGFGDVFMLDNYTGIQTNLSQNNYEFIYNGDVTDRFLIFFTTVSTLENTDELFTIYSHDNNVRVIIPTETSPEIVIYNLVGQKITQTTGHKGINNIPVYETGYYLIKVMDNNNMVTKKVFIK